MAKVELKFIDKDFERDFIRLKSIGEIIAIQTKSGGFDNTICLDVPTAIKFAKTLRAEINKAKGVNNA